MMIGHDTNIISCHCFLIDIHNSAVMSSLYLNVFQCFKHQHSLHYYHTMICYINTTNHLLLYEDCVAYITQDTSFSENQINSLIHQIQNINHESLCLEPSESFLFHSDIDPIIHSPIPGNHDARMDSPN
eukprot:161886_1